MSLYDTALSSLETRGTVPIFPLPNTIFFPQASLPLHIFEPRYRQMTVDALASDRIIAMALLKPGWEKDYLGCPEVFPLACAGVIEGAVPLPDGRFNLRLRGLVRLEILEFVRDTPYRIARTRILREFGGEDVPGVQDEKHRLLNTCAGLLQEMAARPGQPLTVDREIPFDTAVNTLCQRLTMDTATRMKLLEMDDVRERCKVLVALLNQRWKDVAIQRDGGGEDAADENVH